MSAEIYVSHDLAVTRFVGRADEGADRQRWQFTPLGPEGYAILDRRSVRALILVLMRDAWRVARNSEDV